MSQRNSTRPPEIIQFLPNSVREKLLERGSTDAPRAFEALAAVGWDDGRAFDAKIAIATCKPFGIGRDAVYAALATTELFNSEELQPVKDVSLCTHVPEAEKRGRGRPPGAARRYRLASITAICQELGVSNTLSDPLPVKALRSAQAYRSALHGALLLRAPGEYTRGLLAARLGVSRRTLYSYDVMQGVVAEERFTDIEITRANLAQELPEKDRHKRPENRFIFVGNDKRRYFPTQEEARRLLDGGAGRLMLRRQTGNYYETARRSGAPLKE